MMHCAAFVENRMAYRAIFANYCLQEGAVKNS